MFRTSMAAVLVLARLAGGTSHDPRVQTVQTALRKVESGTVTRKQFEARVPRSMAVSLAQLEGEYPRLTRQHKDIATALAYYGIDFHKHTQVLVDCYIRWRSRLKTGGPVAARLEPIVEDIPSDLRLLFEKSRNVMTLRWLLQMELDGASAEIQAREIEQVWQSSPTALLMAANGSSVRLRLLVEVLRNTSETDEERKQLLHDLKRLSTSRYSRVAVSAHRVLENLN